MQKAPILSGEQELKFSMRFLLLGVSANRPQYAVKIAYGSSGYTFFAGKYSIVCAAKTL